MQAELLQKLADVNCCKPHVDYYQAAEGIVLATYQTQKLGPGKVTQKGDQYYERITIYNLWRVFAMNRSGRFELLHLATFGLN